MNTDAETALQTLFDGINAQITGLQAQISALQLALTALQTQDSLTTQLSDAQAQVATLSPANDLTQPDPAIQ